MFSNHQRQPVQPMQTNAIVPMPAPAVARLACQPAGLLSRSAALFALAALLLACFSNRGFAQANANPPTKLTYQGFLTDQNGVPMGNTGPVNKTVIFRIYDALTGGTKLWASQQTVTIDKGHFSVLLGEGSASGSEPFSSDLSSYFSGPTASDRFLELTVDNALIAPRLQFFPSPYSFLASVARRAVEMDGAGITAGTIADARLTANVAKLNADQTFTGINTFGGSELRIKGSSAINFGSDVAGKQGDAGKIGYGTFTGGASGSLDIVGAGSSGNTRRITMWAEGGMQVNGSINAVAFSGNGTIPVGGIIMWSGALNAIPAGWALCNGQTANGQLTPNLQDRFVVGAGSTYAVKNTGGNNSITLSVAQLPPHSHDFTDAYYAENQGRSEGYAGSDEGRDFDNQLFTRRTTTDNTGGGQSIDIRPQFYALAYIMRVQ